MALSDDSTSSSGQLYHHRITLAAARIIPAHRETPDRFTDSDQGLFLLVIE